MINLIRNLETPTPSLNLSFRSNGDLRELGEEESFGIFEFFIGCWDFDMGKG